MYVGFMFISMFIGYSIGSSPVISYHYGAKNKEELKDIEVIIRKLMLL
jgi:Na+-driven multidrug efflux pump